MTLSDIRDEARYPAVIACQFLYGTTGRPLDLKVLHRWRKAGRVRMVRIAGRWFMTGAELRRLVEGVPYEVEAVKPVGAGDESEDDSAAGGGVATQTLAELRALGVDV